MIMLLVKRPLAHAAAALKELEIGKPLTAASKFINAVNSSLVSDLCCYLRKRIRGGGASGGVDLQDSHCCPPLPFHSNYNIDESNWLAVGGVIVKATVSGLKVTIVEHHYRRSPSR